MTQIYHATPYDLSAAGFYFSTYDEYVEKSVNHRNAYGEQVEEYKMQFIDGENCELFKALSVNQANLDIWFNEFEQLSQQDAVKAIYLAEYLGETMDVIIDKLEDVCLFEGTPVEFAENYLEETGMIDQIPENFRYYFDYESYARDMLYSGDITEVEIMGEKYTIWGG